jgi:ABC-type dipeptide/oligopeptide/nickel transport system permease subunit
LHRSCQLERLGGIVGLIGAVFGVVVGVIAGVFGADIGVFGVMLGLALPVIALVLTITGIIHRSHRFLIALSFPDIRRVWLQSVIAVY